ncbi:MAG: DinB family protein [Bacteroidales bacterium]
MENDKKLRERLVKMIRQGSAFMPLSERFGSISYESAGVKVEGFSHTIWELAEHMRIALHDLVEYSKDSHFESPPWPDGYWPSNPGPGSEKEWLESVQRVHDLMDEMIKLVEDPANDLLAPFEANPDHNLLRQATIFVEHNAYHLGQIAMLSKAIERRDGR